MNDTNLPDENSKRFVAVLNKKIEVGKLFNALGHMTAGFAAKYPDTDDLCFLQYIDKDAGVHPNISHFPFIVLRADNSNQIRTVRNECLNRNLPFSDFTSSMTVGTSADQLKRTKDTPEAELEYYGIVFFGPNSELQAFTKKFSIFN